MICTESDLSTWQTSCSSWLPQLIFIYPTLFLLFSCTLDCCVIGLGEWDSCGASKNCKSSHRLTCTSLVDLQKVRSLKLFQQNVDNLNVSELVLHKIRTDHNAKASLCREIWNVEQTQGETLIFWFATNSQALKRCSYSPKTSNLTAGKQGELVRDVRV
jgi:hypothetical protein